MQQERLNWTAPVPLYALLGSIFFRCFQVYLRPIRLWMEEGSIVPQDEAFSCPSLSKKKKGNVSPSYGEAGLGS